jgi:MFS transporter, MHS family, shikimate and dehydroshikimate transport protein
MDDRDHERHDEHHGLMDRLGGEDEGQRVSIRQVAFASMIGTTVEWYDFFLYGTAAALVFNQLFFPEYDPLTGTLLAFGTYAVGFFARPVGGIVAGHYGDKIGRKAMLVLTLLIMGVATFLIGLLPTYQSIGIWAPILLLVMRLLQGFGIGGEWGGAVLMAVEHSPANRRGFYGSWPQIGVPAGLLTANLVFLLVNRSISEEAWLAWGWRIPFLLSIILIAVGMFIRLRISETPAFNQVRQTHTEARMPIVDVLRTYPKEVLQAMGMRIAENGAFYVFSIFVLTYVVEALDLESTVALTGVLIGAAIGLFSLPLWGWLSDRVGRRPVYLFGAVFSLLFAFPFFWLMNTEATIFIWVAIILSLVLGHDAMYGPQAAYFSELFGTRVRYSGASLGYQLASVLAGGLSPLIATALLAAYGYQAVAWYLAGMAVITIIAVITAAETYRGDIVEERPEERGLHPEAEVR